MNKPHELNQQMLNYLLSMSREQQNEIPPGRVALIAWLGTDAGLTWLARSPVGAEVARRREDVVRLASRMIDGGSLALPEGFERLPDGTWKEINGHA